MGAVAGLLLLLLLSVFAVFDFQGRLAAAAAAAAALEEQLLSNSNGHGLHERSISTNCQERQGFQRNLTAHTHKYEFLDLSGSVTLAWVGDGTGVLLALTTFQLPLLGVNFGQSRLYRSENYGKTFSDITKLINNTFIRTEFGIAIGPENSGKLRMNTGLKMPAIFLLILADSLKRWGQNDTIFFTTHPNGSCTARGLLELKRTDDFGRTFKTIGSKIYSFGLGGHFLFASVMTDKISLRALHVSLDMGDTWNMVQLPHVSTEQFYSILAANDDMVFMHVDDPGDTGFGTIYVSDDRGIVYSKSLSRHLYTTTGGETDFTNVTSLRGVYVTSVLAEDGSVQSVITFDRGGEWQPLRKPENSDCDSTAKNKDECSLHIHASYSISQKLNVPMLPLSEPNAVGLIVAHGSVGDAISVMMPDVYVSDDGGYSWFKALKGPHHYTILDSGGLIVAVEHNEYNSVNTIKFSIDEGQCWYSYKFIEKPIVFTGLASEPGAKSMNVSIWGYVDLIITQHWISVTIDFEELLTRDCSDDDYIQWLAHSSNVNDPNDGCILGYKEKFRRLRKSSLCRNGHDYIVNKQPNVCQCTLDDYLCDFGYYREENSSECVEQADLQGHDLEFCLQGRKEILQTNGYRKIPGDKCYGGVQVNRLVKDMSKKCVSNLLAPAELSDSRRTSSVPIIATVIVLLLMLLILGVIFIKKYVCGGRFLVHRYSVLQQHAESTTADELDTAAVTNKPEYHDDSDEDLLE
ncbi:hypothetical protein chiPu_0007930 [Chiloscyllium punctatum]|uniref:VPS10 domain-containing protein n=1 Tax=Chiloscyllium punctatum TaxID=137246 RepID=A0A401SGF5_CHIPU|nr:hypothetical protein [Chiloscyllium punctatum]